MLSLTRKDGEAVILTVAGIEIRVLVTSTERGRCRLHFQAPPMVNIVREELIDKAQEEPTS